MRGIALDTLLTEGIDLLTIDLEGGEFAILPGSQRVQQLKVVVGEVHAAPGSAEVGVVLEVFEDFEITTNEPGPGVVYTLFRATQRT